MKVLSKISILIAVALLQLHTLLPHEHHATLITEGHLAEYESAHSFLEVIRITFHLDQGEGHLESYEVTDNLQFNCAALAIDLPVFSFELEKFDSPKLEFPIDHTTLVERYFFSKLRFRGPPSLA